MTATEASEGAASAPNEVDDAMGGDEANVPEEEEEDEQAAEGGEDAGAEGDEEHPEGIDGSDAVAAAEGDDEAQNNNAADGDEDGNQGDQEKTPVDPELEEMKRRVQEMEDEAAKLKAMQQELQQEAGADASGSSPGAGPPKNTDETSIYVGQVDYDATPEELQNHFASCGTINRVTILCDRYTGRSKGYGYIEFEHADSVQNALMLDNSIFKGRQLKVTAKRTNIPGRGRAAGRGGRGAGGPPFRGRGRGGFYRGGGYGGYRGGGYRGGYRGGGYRGGYRPY